MCVSCRSCSCRLLLLLLLLLWELQMWLSLATDVWHPAPHAILLHPLNAVYLGPQLSCQVMLNL